jgi:hypothetical protein
MAIASASMASGSLASATPDSPKMTCAVSGPLLRIKVREWGESNAYWIVRHNDAILARERTRLSEPTSVPCAGDTPTVRNIDRIEVNQNRPPGSEDVPSSSRFVVDMSHGGFTPGATAEDDGSSEIETQLNLPRSQVWILAPPGRNHVRFGVRHETLGLNLNRDKDIEVEMSAPYLGEVYAGDGADVVDGRTDKPLSPRPRLFLWGEDGDDRMIGGGRRDQLIGGNGADTLIGTHGATQLAGGAGPDRLRAGPQSTLLQGDRGNDHLDARNHELDWISCGPGVDRARADQREDFIGRCEHAPRVHTRF